jgi:hypothetical protein
MVERVGDDRVLGPEERFEEAAIGVEAGGEEDGVVLAEEAGEAGLQVRWMSCVPQMKRTLAMP